MTDLTALVGLAGAPFRFVVEAGKAAEFARSVQAEDPLFTDDGAAQAAGLTAVLAPPTFSAASAFWATPESALVSQLGLDLKRVLAGGGEWEYLAPVLVGDELEVVNRVDSVQEKTGSRGVMTIIRIRTEYRRAGELVQTYTNDIIQFGSATGAA